MTDESSGERRTSRRLAVSLRFSLIFVLAAALGAAWIAWQVREQREVKALVLRHDGMFHYEFEPQTVTPYQRKTWVPSWLRRAIGEEYFHDVTWVRIEGARFGDAELERLKAFDRIETLGIAQTAISDAGLRRLRGRAALKGLFLGGNWIGDAGIDNLGLETLPQLELLEIRCTQVTDAKLAEIKRRFPKLMILDNGRSYRFIAPGEGRGNDRYVKSVEQEPGGRREIPPPNRRKN